MDCFEVPINEFISMPVCGEKFGAQYGFPSGPAVPDRSSVFAAGIIGVQLQNIHEGFLRNLDITDHLHPLLAFLLFF